MNHNLALLTLPILALLLICAVAASARETPNLRAVTGTIENDSASGTDRNYTNGFRLSWTFSEAERDPITRWAATRLLSAKTNSRVFRGLSFGQSIFTPRDIERPTPPPNQRPYGAWLYADYAVLVQHQDRVDRLSLQIGLAGDNALGGEVQNEVHRLLGIERALGWDSAIDGEVGVVLRFNRRYPALGTGRLGLFEYDVTPVVGLTVGNILSDIGAGAMLRIGQTLEKDFGPPRVRPSLVGAGDFARHSRFHWYAFAGIEGRYVAHDFFISGSLFRDDRLGLEPRRGVIDLSAGVVLQYRRAQLAFSFVDRSEQFEAQEGSQSFASVSFGYRF
ncbi:MAG: lipid A deacylase LpxR family protein [Pseudomonadota bacterium]